MGGIGRFLMQSLVSAFIVMIFIYIIKKGTVGKNIPFVSTVAEAV